jgi:hypothetical protein
MTVRAILERMLMNFLVDGGFATWAVLTGVVSRRVFGIIYPLRRIISLLAFGGSCTGSVASPP